MLSRHAFTVLVNNILCRAAALGSASRFEMRPDGETKNNILFKLNSTWNLFYLVYLVRFMIFGFETAKQNFLVLSAGLVTV